MKIDEATPRVDQSHRGVEVAVVTGGLKKKNKRGIKEIRRSI
jgi:hypothetical protein